MAEEVKSYGLRGNMLTLQEKYCSISIEISADMLAVVARAEKSLDLERQVTMREHALVKVEGNL